MIDNLVSIVTPVYNSEKFLEYTINSIIAQTYKNWELILVDDGSIDSSSKIIKKYTLKDKRINHINIKKNEGVANARNVGVQKAKGRYIAFIDSDDIWDYKKLEKQIEFMKKNNYEFTFTNYEIIDENNNILNKVRYTKEKVNYKILLKDNVIGCSTVVIDRNKIKNIKMPKIKHEDYATWLNILKNNNGFGLLENLTKYRIVKNSLSNNKFKCAGYTWSIYREHERMSMPKSIYYFLYYALNSVRKRVD